MLSVGMIIQAQIITINDAFSSEALEMATVYQEERSISVFTNSEGHAEISQFRDLNEIKISRLGYQTIELDYSEFEKLNYLILMEPVAFRMDEIVVSATKWGLSANKSPARIISISAKTVSLQNPQTAADLLGSSGEVFIQKSQQGGGSPMIRGFAANRLLYSIDGVRMNSAIFRSGNLQNVISLDPLAIEKTEVFFGPGSVIYGSDAIGGVMSFQTLTPEFSLNDHALITGKALSRYASASNELTGHFDINLGGKKWASLTSLSYSSYQDLKMGSEGPDDYLKRFYVQRINNADNVMENPDPEVQDPSGYDQINLMQKIRFSPAKSWDFQYAFHYSETTEYARYDRLIETQSNGLPVSAVWNYGPQKWMMNQLSFRSDLRNILYDSMILRLSQQFFEESRIDRKFNHHRLRTNLEEVQAYTANLDFEKIAGKHRLFYGTEYILNHVRSAGSAVDIRDGSPIYVPDRYPQSDWSSYAVYLNYQLELSGKTVIHAGARYNAFDIQSDFTRHLEFFPFDFTASSIRNSAVTGSLGAVFSPDKSWKISINAGTGFRAPNVDDIGKIFDFVSGEVIVPNTDLSAEYAYNAELGISKVFGNMIRLDLNGFYTYLDHAMVRREFKVNGQDSILYDGVMSKVYAIQNAAFGTVYGFNLGAEIKLPAGFSLSTRYNYQLGREEMDNGTVSPSRHAAPAFGISRVNWEKDRLSMQWYVMYSDEVSNEELNPEEQGKPFIYAKDQQGNPWSPAWYTLNFKAMYQFHQNMTIISGVENITDQRYRPYSSGLAAPGRNFLLTLKLHF